MSRNFHAWIVTGGDAISRKDFATSKFGNKLHSVERKNASFGVEDVKKLRQLLSLRIKENEDFVIYFEQAQLLTEAAQNAMLSILESDAEHSRVICVLDCDSTDSILDTIKSRAQMVCLLNLGENDEDFVKALISLNSIVSLSEGYQEREQATDFMNRALSWLRVRVRSNPTSSGIQVLAEVADLMRLFRQVNIQPRLAVELVMMSLLNYLKVG